MASANNLGTAYIRIAPQMDGIQSSISRKLAGVGSEAGTSFNSGFSLKAAGLAGVIGGVAAKAADKVITAVFSSLDDAIKRVDTLNTFPKIMKNLGFETEESSAAVQKLSDRIEGLPTTLDEIVSYTQRLASTTGNLNEGMYNATNLAIAFNDAALAGGKGQYEANRAFEQFTQVISRGRPSMQDWKIMMEVMPGQLKQLAKYMGENNKSLQDYAKTAKKTTDQLDGMDLYEWISENKNENAKERLQDLQKALIDLDNKGGAGITSFKDQVKDATQTIGTALRLIPVRITKAIAQVIGAFDTKKIYTIIDKFSSSFKKVADIIVKYVVPPIKKYVIPTLENLVSIIATVGKKMVAAFTPAIHELMDSVGGLLNILKTTTAGISNFLSSLGGGKEGASELAKALAQVVTKGIALIATIRAVSAAVAAGHPVLAALAAVALTVAYAWGSVENANNRASIAQKYHDSIVVNSANIQRDLNKALEVHQQILDDIALKEQMAEDAEYQYLQAKQKAVELQNEYNEMLKAGTYSADELRMKELEVSAAIRERDAAEKNLKTSEEELSIAQQQRIDSLASELLAENKAIGASMLQKQAYGDLAAQIDELSTSTIKYIDEEGNLIEETKQGSKDFADGLAFMLRQNDDTWKKIVDTAQSEGISYVEAAKRVGNEAGKGLDTSFAGGIKDAGHLVKESAHGVVADSKEYAKKEAALFHNIGQLIARGTQSGINSLAGEVRNAATSMVSAAVSAAKSMLKIKSPSRVFAEIGKFMDLGLVKGLNDYEDEVRKAAESVADTAISAVDRDASMGLNLNSNGRLPRPSSFFNSSEPTQVVQNNVFNQVSDELDLKAISRQLGWEVATVI